jgi:type VI secretion system protein ImpI/type VI secretion system protein
VTRWCATVRRALAAHRAAYFRAVRARPAQTTLLSRLLPQARDAALWQAYEAEFKAMADETEQAYLDVFAKNFKKAYARNLARADDSKQAGGR